MSYFVYILYSVRLDRYYIGTTDSVSRRLVEHNNGKYKDAFTVRGIPWELKLSYELNDNQLAYKLEGFIKRMKSRKFIKKIIADTTILDDVVQHKLN